MYLYSPICLIPFDLEAYKGSYRTKVFVTLYFAYLAFYDINMLLLAY